MAEFLQGFMIQNKLDYEELCSPSLELGEGLHWDQFRQLLWFVDIYGKNLFYFEPEKKRLKKFIFDDLIGWVITNYDNNLILGLRDKIIKFNPEKNISEILFLDMLESPNLRLNDAKALKNGFILAGCMSTDAVMQPIGSLHLITSSKCSKIDDDYIIPNGPVVLENSYILHTDSFRKTIYQIKLNNLGSKILEKKTWKQFQVHHGNPDGMCIDRDKNIWIAFWGEGAVRKFSINGELLNEIFFPEKYITNVCFGGKNLNKLFVTSAKNSNESDQKKEKTLGSLYEIHGHNTFGGRIYSAKI